MIALFIIAIALFASTATAQDYVEAATVDPELRQMTAVLFFFFAIVVVGTYTTHHWEQENRGRMIGILFRFGPLGVSSTDGKPMGEVGFPFFVAKTIWWILYTLWALAVYFIWITKDQQTWVWYWSWSLFGVALLADKIWPYLYFYTSGRSQVPGVVLALVSLAANLIASLIIWFGQYFFFGGFHLLVGNILLDVFIVLYLIFVFNLGFTSYSGRNNASGQMQMQRPQGYPAQSVYGNQQPPPQAWGQ